MIIRRNLKIYSATVCKSHGHFNNVFVVLQIARAGTIMMIIIGVESSL